MSVRAIFWVISFVTAVIMIIAGASDLAHPYIAALLVISAGFKFPVTHKINYIAEGRLSPETTRQIAETIARTRNTHE